MTINLEGVVSAQWQNIPAQEIFPGIRKRALWQDANGAKAQVLEIDAGARFTTIDPHWPGPEEVFVVSGVFNDGSTIIQQVPSFTILPVPRIFHSQSKAA